MAKEDRDNQIRRTARVLDIISQISSEPNYWTRKKLALHHEISERMIQKDLELITVRLGLPLKNGHPGYFFTYLPQLPSALFSFSEAIAILSAARAAQAIPGVNSSDLAAAITRLESIFPEEIRPLLKASLDRLPVGNCRADRQSTLLLLNRAYYEQKQVRILYKTQNQSESKSREVEPYAILPYGRSWFLIAFDSLRKAVLQFKIDRILEAELLEVSYRIPPNFQIDEYLGDGWGMMRGAASAPEEVILNFDNLSGRWVVEETWHKSQQNVAREDGSFEVRFFVGITPEMINWLLYYGDRVRILKPDWLRQRVLEEHRKACSQTEFEVNGNE